MKTFPSDAMKIFLAFLSFLACSRAVEIHDFDARAARWAKDMEAVTGKDIRWVDMYYTRPELVSHAEYKPYQIALSVARNSWGSVNTDVTRPGWNYVQWFHNGGTNPIVSTFSKSTEYTDSFEWGLTSGMSCSISEQITVGIPELIGADINLEASFSLDESISVSKSKTETFSIQNEITIPPKSSLKAEWIITEHEVDIPFSADVTIQGYIAVWYEQKIDDHWLWFYPIHFLADEYFVYQAPGKLTFHEEGRFRGVRGVEHYLNVTEVPLYASSDSVGEEVLFLKGSEIDLHPIPGFV
ncbi:uncharacterized protein LOC143020373 [Oratosquilla oratoria]|uniref:uncharacterized protein LOC143020373 n=1 Tax=Oratosquilla oratoria TaxID=337810 RepID=UPI003F768FD0